MNILKNKQVVQTETGHSCVIDHFLGGGAQGEVYQAVLDGETVALKWYFPESATPEQHNTLKKLIEKGPPSNKFLWPQDLTTAKDVPGFGYVMPLRDARYKSIVDLMKRRAEPSFYALATAGFELSDSYLQLHAMGMSYRDISFGNVFFDPDSGKVLICDNDNVTIDGRGSVGVLGTPGFMAPEIVRGEAHPSIQTDLFSLAVLLFYMFMVAHPLDGEREAKIHSLDLPARKKLYGTDPLFIFDPDDDSNRPVPGIHDNALIFWTIYPQFLRDLFTKAFTIGLHNPHSRVRESEWREAMVRLRDTIFYCAHCGAENFYDLHVLRTQGGNPGLCWKCHKQLRLPSRIRLGNNIVMLNYNTQLFPHHIDEQNKYDFSHPIATVTRHPHDARKWGLKNLSNEKWVIITINGAVLDVEPGRNVALTQGTKINFGKIEGEIRF